MPTPRLIACSLAFIAVASASASSPNTNAKVWSNGGTFEWDGPKKGNMSHDTFWKQTKAPTNGKAFHLSLSGFKAKAAAQGPIELTKQSTIVADSGGSLDFNHNPIYFGHRTALVLDASTCRNLGPLVKSQNPDSSLDIILTKNSMLDGKDPSSNAQRASWSALVAKQPSLCAISNGSTVIDTSSIFGAATIELLVTVNSTGTLFEANDWEIALEGQKTDGANTPTHITYVVDPGAKQTRIFGNGKLIGTSNDVPDFSSKKAVVGNPNASLGSGNQVHSFAAFSSMLTPQEIASHAAAALSASTSTANDLGGGTVMIVDSTMKLPSLTNAAVTIEGYGSLTITQGGKPIASTSINLKGARTRVHLTNKKPHEVIRQDLDKFSINGKLPVYGARPEIKEPGDNIIIKSDRADGTLIVPVKN
ncbi:hypothetical protein [Sulfuriroseicoccus oceanibius]|uniref:Uncharacterized protein n=1 Tax=Sulfuriroseicoccus oceanibius TaxID=2707525 RepID=A0A6B3LEA8_9BACT|nr:hypothetical protein [Sulfuriroseicoccus oceanibius]QQL45652.1 hypothetical protein G3M56_003415 [Sulfuriroseicoccus oceanibius]